jgi:hypothetical protein
MFPANPDFSITILSQTQLLKMVVELTRHITTLFNFSAPEAQKISLYREYDIKRCVDYVRELLRIKE